MATPRLDSLELPGADGLPLRVSRRTGARPGEKRPSVVIVHGFKGFKDWGFFPKLAERLARAGFSAWSFNLSGSGVSEGDRFDQPERWYRQRPTADLADVATVVDRARQDGSGWVALVGHSRGGGLAVLHAAGDERIGALVTWAAIDDFNRFSDDEVAKWRRDGRLDVRNQRTGEILTIGPDGLADYEAHKDGALNVLAAASRVRAPWLIVHGTRDPAVDVSAARRLASAGATRAELLLLDGADHTFGIRHPWAGSTPEYDEVAEQTAGFLMKAL